MLLNWVLLKIFYIHIVLGVLNYVALVVTIIVKDVGYVHNVNHVVIGLKKSAKKE